MRLKNSIFKARVVILFVLGISCTIILDFIDQFHWITLCIFLMFSWLLFFWIPRTVLIVSTISLGTIAAVVLAAEVTYRVAFLKPPERFVTRNLSHIKPESEADITRILGLSDSFGTAGGREHNYHYVLEKFLSDGNRHVEMINVSLYAMEPPDQLQLLKKLGPRYKPDIILHGFFVGNDFSSPERPIYFDSTGAALRDRDRLSRLRPRNFLVRKWFLWLYKSYKFRRQQKTTNITNEGYVVLPSDTFLSIERDRLNFFQKTSSPAEKFRRTLDDLNQIRSEAKRLNAIYIMVIHPDQIQVDEHLFNEVIKKFNYNPAEFDLRLLQRLLIDHCNQTQTLCMDLFPIFKKAESEKSLYLLRNTHYNQEGNMLVADSIAKFLRDKQVFP
jgi:hypothetical protein